MRAVLASDAARLPEIARIRRRYAEDRFWRASPVITRAIERGELPPRTDPDEVLKTLIAPILLRLLFTAEPVDEATAHSYDRWACALTRRYLRAHRARTRGRVERARPGRRQFKFCCLVIDRNTDQGSGPRSGPGPSSWRWPAPKPSGAAARQARPPLLLPVLIPNGCGCLRKATPSIRS
jgi:hypothetical protein